MELNLKDKNALVCASSQGLGKAAAIDLASEGVNLAICSRDKEKIEACKKEIQDVVGNKAKIIALQANLDNPEEIKTLYAEAAEYLGSVDILVNNTGGPPPSIFENLEDEDWQKAFNSTMMSCIRLSKLALPSMKEKKWGRIINISSVSVKSPVAGLFLSNSLRMGVLGWAKALSDEVAPFGVTVNTVCPGYTRTERVEAILESQSKSSGLNKEEIEKNIASNIPMQRVGEAEDLAGLITFLASQKGDYMTGLAVQVDGGSARTFT
jgi:3-oxoacyl-[acyl-carrier protein] reductase|tara:strand:+ start:852 stop:1649 length:798 start_codon:yes stop_codon:yes gene_type:complete